MALSPKNNDPKEPKLCDFSYISMTNPPTSLLGLKMAKKGVLCMYYENRILSVRIVLAIFDICKILYLG